MPASTAVEALETQNVLATRTAARRLRALLNDPLPDEVHRAAAACLIDHVAACMGGLSTPWAPAILRYVASCAGKPEAHQWGLPAAVAAESAAFGNAALGHSLIYDDMHVMSASHVGVLVIPAALALAQRDGWSGTALLHALVGGYEMATRLGVAVRVGGRTDHFRPSGICGPFGAAAAAASGAGADEDTTTNALGFAANTCAGVNEWPWAGGQEIYTHAGMAARNGIASFELARAGMRASGSVLEGRDGLFAAYGAGDAGMQAFVSSLNKGYAILETHHKPFAGCNLIQAPIAAALAAGAKVAGRTSDIEAIVIKTFAQARSYPGCDNAGPFDQVQQSKMSLQYGVASAVLYGRVDEETYVRFDDAELGRLLACTRIEIVPEYVASLQKLMQPACVDIWLRGGEMQRAAVEDVPWLSEEAIVTRFRKEAEPYLTGEQQTRFIELAENLGTQESCGPLFEVLSQARIGRIAGATGAL